MSTVFRCGTGCCEWTVLRRRARRKRLAAVGRELASLVLAFGLTMLGAWVLIVPHPEWVARAEAGRRASTAVGVVPAVWRDGGVR